MKIIWHKCENFWVCHLLALGSFIVRISQKMFESHNSVELKKHSENDSLYCFVVSLSLFLNFFGVCEYSVFSIFPSWLQLNYWFLIIHILMFFFKYFFITSTVDCPILSASKQNFSYYLFLISLCLIYSVSITWSISWSSISMMTFLLIISNNTFWEYNYRKSNTPTHKEFDY